MIRVERFSTDGDAILYDQESHIQSQSCLPEKLLAGLMIENDGSTCRDYLGESYFTSHPEVWCSARRTVRQV